MAYNPERDPFRWRAIMGEGEADPRPAFTHAWEVLRDHAEASLERRRRLYPAMVQRGQISAEAAEADMAAWAELLAEWRWVIDGEGTPPPAATLPARLAALTRAKETIERQMRGGDHSELIYRQWNAVEAMGWNLTRPPHAGLPAHHFAAVFNHAVRHEQGQRYCHVCERWCEDPVVRACTELGCGLRPAPAPEAVAA